MSSSPQADLWLKEATKSELRFNVAIVPDALLNGYKSFMRTVKFRLNIVDTWSEAYFRRTVHPTILDKIDAERAAFGQRFRQVDARLFAGQQHLVLSMSNKMLNVLAADDDGDMLARFHVEVGRTLDSVTLGFSSAIRYRLDANTVTSLPIPSFHMSTPTIAPKKLRYPTRPRRKQSPAACGARRTREACQPPSQRRHGCLWDKGRCTARRSRSSKQTVSNRYSLRSHVSLPSSPWQTK